MALWSVMASPLINGADIRALDAAHLAILTNPNLLAVNRDPNCVMGERAHVRTAACMRTCAQRPAILQYKRVLEYLSRYGIR